MQAPLRRHEPAGAARARFGADIPFADAGRFTAFPGVPSVLPSYDIPGINTGTSAGTALAVLPAFPEQVSHHSISLMERIRSAAAHGHRGCRECKHWGRIPAFDAYAVRRDFPILNELVNGRR